MRRGLVCLGLLCGLVLMAVQGLAATYYVDCAYGSDAWHGASEDAAWATVQHAVDNAVAGDTILVRGGTCNERVEWNVSGSAGDGDITLAAYPGETPVLDGTGLTVTDDHPALITIDGRHHITIDGLEIRNYATSRRNRTAIGILVTGAASNVTIRGTVIHGIASTASVDSDRNGRDAHGILVAGTDGDTAITGVTISGNELYDLTLGSSEALSVNGNVDGFTVSGNHVHDVDNIGIDCIGYEETSPNTGTDRARNGTIADNVVRNVSSYGNPAYGKVYAAAGIYVDGGADIVVERNTVTACDYGLELASEHAGTATSGVVARSNLLAFNNAAGIAMGGYDEERGSTQECHILFNTLYGNDVKEEGNGELYLQYDVRDCVIQNNILHAATGRESLIVNEYTANSGNTVDHNLYYAGVGASAARFRWKNTVYDGFTAYVAATWNDVQSGFAAPMLTDAGNAIFQLGEGSPAVNAGAGTANAGNTDLAGNPRLSGGSYDLGAYERTMSARPTSGIWRLLLLD